jgi:carbon monoxide dehydrogenase subunit G
MELKGDHTFEADRQTVWDLMLDPEAIQNAIPGCESMVRRPGERDLFDITVKVGLAAIKGTYTGTVEVADQVPGESYRLIAGGQAKPGKVEGSALMRLSDDGPNTRVVYTGEVKAQGAIARLGGRILGGASKLMIGQFFKGMDKQVQARKSGATPGEGS